MGRSLEGDKELIWLRSLGEPPLSLGSAVDTGDKWRVQILLHSGRRPPTLPFLKFRDDFSYFSAMTVHLSIPVTDTPRAAQPSSPEFLQ